MLLSRDREPNKHTTTRSRSERQLGPKVWCFLFRPASDGERPTFSPFRNLKQKWQEDMRQQGPLRLPDDGKFENCINSAD
mmetsp:Transcript_10762/g.19649  ORF Transcript_10762/g.19649 Transcript_10762/m.19649 type:complete len:80 (+) Transcript_10762:34-273(+)